MINSSFMESRILWNYSIRFPPTVLKNNYKVGLVIPIYNRAKYVRRCFRSLQASQLQDTVVILMDDASTDQDTTNLIDGFFHRDAPVIKMVRKRELYLSSVDYTLPTNLSISFNYLLCFFSCRYLCILDSDTLVKPDWLNRLCRLHESFTAKKSLPVIVSGFNTLAHSYIQTSSKNFVYKESLGGINMLFTSDLYEEVVFPVNPRWDEVVGHRMKKKGYKMICIRPSVIQHIGYKGSFSNSYIFSNTAFDYNSSLEAWIRRLCHLMIQKARMRANHLLKKVGNQKKTYK